MRRNRGTAVQEKKGKYKKISQTEGLELLMEADGGKPLEIPSDCEDSGQDKQHERERQDFLCWETDI